MHELATSLKGGDVVSGVVKNTTNFGAFISLASPDGKLHGAVVRWNLLAAVLRCIEQLGSYARDVDARVLNPCAMRTCRAWFTSRSCRGTGWDTLTI